MHERVAFIGLTGPIMYDYKHNLDNIYPNPILENAFGLMVFYGKIVFLHRSLCPKSMQHLNFVKFLSDDIDLVDYIERVKREEWEDYRLDELAFKRIGELKERIAPFATYDNHSKSIGKNIPFSTSVYNMFVDNAIAHFDFLYRI